LRLVAGDRAVAVVAINRAIAIGMLRGPALGLQALAPLAGDKALARYLPYHLAIGDLELRRDDNRAAQAALHGQRLCLFRSETDRSEAQASGSWRARIVLSINRRSCARHVGNSAARFAQRVGVDVWAVPTVLLSNHPGHGHFRGEVTPAARIDDLIAGLGAHRWLARCDGVLSGYLALRIRRGLLPTRSEARELARDLSAIGVR
jgi:hypothetical protein